MARAPQVPANVPSALLKALAERRTRAPRSLHRALFNIADSYSVTASLALEQLKTTGKTDFGTVAVVNASFAIELLLKFFVAVDRPTKTAQELVGDGLLTGHEYSKLWPRFSDLHKAAFVEKFYVRTKRTVSPEQFLGLLQEIGDSPFVFWRYSYEHTKPVAADLTQLGHLMHALGEAAADAMRAAERAARK